MHSSSFSPHVYLRGGVLAALGAATLCVYAVATFRATPHGLLDLGTWLALAALLALESYLSASTSSSVARADEWVRRRGLRLRPLVFALGMALVTCCRYVIYLRIGGDFLGITTLMWMSACAALVSAAWPARPLALRETLAAHRSEALALLGLTGLGAALRFWSLGVYPRIINGDEGLIGTWAQDTAWASGILTMPFAAMDGVGTLYLRLMNVVFGIIGPSAFSLRLLPAIAGTLAIPAAYLLARHLLGPRAALIAATLLTFSHVHVHFSRTVAVSYIYTTLFVPLALYFLLSGLERKSPLRMVLSVLMVGLHINTYVDGWVWLVLLFLLLVAWALVDRELFRGSGAALATFGLALAVIISPMVIWGVLFPAEFSSRMAVDGTFTSGWLEREVVITGKHQALLVAELFLAALGTFTHRPFVDFYGVGVPTLDTVTAILWCIGLALALWRTRDRRMLVLNGWFWGGVVALGVTTIPPSTYHYRLLVSLPAAIMFAALGAETLLRIGERRGERSADTQPAMDVPIRAGVAAVVLIGVAYLNLNTYYGSFVGACKYEMQETRQAGMLGKYLHVGPRDTAVFVLPQEHGFRAGPFMSVDFLSGRMPLTNIDAPLDAGRPAELTESFPRGLLVVAVPERAKELAAVEEWYPGGQRTALLDCGAEVLELYEWHVPARSVSTVTQ